MWPKSACTEVCWMLDLIISQHNKQSVSVNIKMVLFTQHHSLDSLSSQSYPQTHPVCSTHTKDPSKSQRQPPSTNPTFSANPLPVYHLDRFGRIPHLPTSPPTQPGKKESESKTIRSKHLVSNPSQQVPGNNRPRRQWSSLNRFRTGHGPCLASLHKWGSSPSLCACGDQQTMEHIIEASPLHRLKGRLATLHTEHQEATVWLDDIAFAK